MWAQWLRLPLVVRFAMIFLALIAIVALTAAVDHHAGLFLLACLSLTGALLSVYFVLRRWRTKRVGERFARGLTSASDYSPKAVADPAQRARLAELRNVFEAGLGTFSEAGKDLYSLPWYLVCGEPGSGKTETIRRSNVGFPPGLQDEMQGVGGTINMHWWFTNHAILLDTAGKMLFGETQPGTSSEWREFLNLLKAHRSKCPVNGLLLIIPADSLLTDTPDEIQRKAGRIVHQLDQIQKILDVRFPVFVLITKCDLVYGFREFFTNVREAQLQHQMMGWSNPEPLDVPFRPELVTKHIEVVSNRLRRRRMLLMRDPVPVSQGRRIDEVDSSYELPQSLTTISPRLKQYLDVIFVSGEWTQRPLFLRGIYFTSSLIEGNALDVELARALGIPVEHLADGKCWDRERSFFLRDLFLQKIFRERGLVTGASDTRALLRKRRVTLVTAAGAALTFLLFMSWAGANALKESVLAEKELWQTAAGDWSGGRWHPIIEPIGAVAHWRFAGEDPVKIGERILTVTQFHDELQRTASRDVVVPWVFRPMEHLVAETNKRRREAQRVVFEASVTEPLVEATRRALFDTNAPWTDLDADRMAFLLKLEGAIAYGRAASSREKQADTLDASYFFGITLQPWLNFNRVSPELLRVFRATLPRTGANAWPEPWMSGGKSLGENLALSQGWSAFAASTHSLRGKQQAGIEQIRDTLLAVEQHLATEKRFLAAVFAASREQGLTDMDDAFASLTASRSRVDAMLKRTAALQEMPESLFTLQSAYRAFIEQSRVENHAAGKTLTAAMDTFASQREVEEDGCPADLPLFKEIRLLLSQTDQAIDEAFKQSLTPEEINGIPKLDMQATLPLPGTADRVYAYRYNVYRDLLEELKGSPKKYPTLLGHAGEAFSYHQATLDDVKARLAKYEGEWRPEFTRAARGLLERAETEGTAAIAERHGAEFDRLVAAKGGFPVVRGAPGMSEEEVRNLYARVQTAMVDTKIDGVPDSAKFVYNRALEKIIRLMEFLNAVARPSGQGQSLRVEVAGLAEQRRVIEQIAPGQSFARVFAGNRFRTLRTGDKAVRTQAGSAMDLAITTLTAPLPDLEFFVGADTKAKPDAHASFLSSWPALQLIFDKTSVAEEGGKKWLCPISISTPEGPAYFVLSLTVDVSLPPLDRWPTTAENPR